MKRILLLLVLVTATSALAMSQTPDKKSDKNKPVGEKVAASSKVEQELIQLDREWSQAGVAKDAAVLDRVLADDFSGTIASGKVSTKAEAIADLKSDAGKLESNTTSDYNVRVFGDTAVMTHSGVRAGQREGQAFTENYRSIHVFVKRGGHWQAVASQGMVVPQQ